MPNGISINQSIKDRLSLSLTSRSDHQIFAFYGPWVDLRRSEEHKTSGSDIDFVIVDNYRGIFFIEVKGGAYQRNGKLEQKMKGRLGTKSISGNLGQKIGIIKKLYEILKHDIREKGHGSLLRVLSYHKILCITGTNQPLPPEEVSKWDNIIYENFSRQIPDYISKEYQPYEKDQGITQMIFEKPFDDICSFFENLVKINPDFKEYFRPQEPAAPVPKPSKPLTKTVARPNVLSTSEREFQDMAQKAAIPSKPNMCLSVIQKNSPR